MDRTTARAVTAEDISDLVARHVPEENALEYKAVPDADLLKAACAIANFGGGFILIGVEEDGDHAASGIRHIERSRDVADSIRQKLRDALTPRPVFEVVPLTVDDKDVIVIRISPQNRPHMISSDKRTDFFNRYDSTSEKMRYDEIEQFFREKHAVVENELPTSPRAILETTLGRTEVSQGAKGYLDDSLSGIKRQGTALFALVAASDGNLGSISEQDALRAFQSPLYDRKGGWLVVHPKHEVTSRPGAWLQAYGSYGQTTITTSGDLVFVKAIDDVLCWTQKESDFSIAPQIYPNALVEYCLSFVYVLADLIGSSRPSKLLVVPTIQTASLAPKLSLGEGGSIWYSSQARDARSLHESIEGIAIAEPLSVGHPLRCRNLAYRLVSQIYSFFGYLASDVPFAADEEVIVEPDADTATLTSLRAYLRDTLLVPLAPARDDFERSCFTFALHLEDGPRMLWVSEEFVADHHLSERKLFDLLDTFKISDAIRALSRGGKLLLSTAGIGSLPE